MDTTLKHECGLSACCRCWMWQAARCSRTHLSSSVCWRGRIATLEQASLWRAHVQWASSIQRFRSCSMTASPLTVSSWQCCPDRKLPGRQGLSLAQSSDPWPAQAAGAAAPSAGQCAASHTSTSRCATPPTARAVRPSHASASAPRPLCMLAADLLALSWHRRMLVCDLQV